MKKIQVTTKTVYGVEHTYPVCDTARLFAALANQKTLTWNSLNLIKNAGYEVEYVNN